MKKIFYLSISALALLAIATSCSDEELTKEPNNLPQGNGIVFGASAGYADDSRSRTIYGEKNPGNTSQAIEWVAGDQVSMYSPTSPITQADYKVCNIDKENRSSAYLAAPQNGLQWGGSTQDFYAIYPAPSSMSNETIKNLVSFENGKLTGYIPVNQAHTLTHNGNTWTAQPVMDYLYMSAVAKGVEAPTADNEQDGVSLDFVPLTTTLEITVHGTATSDNTPIVQLNVFSDDGDNIAGYFTCDLVNGETDSQGYPVCEYQSSSTVRNMITVSTYYNSGTTDSPKYTPMTLGADESVTFNVFLLPHENMSNLRLRIVGLNTTGKQMVLAESGEPITLHPHKKTCIEVDAPTFQGGETNNWITALDDNVIISQLSIPGTANSFSYNYRGNNPDMYKTQTVNFEKQWNSGIRCFELKCPNNNAGNSLEGVELQCNGQNLDITFGEAVKMIWDKVNASEGEFAMIIPFFESQSGRGNNVIDFAYDLNQFFSDHYEYKYVTYGTRVTLGKAAKSLMFVARISSEEDDDALLKQMPSPTQGVFVSQWGSLKDNWERRGYMINGMNVQNWATSGTYSNPQETPTMEYYMMNENTTSGRNYTNDSFTPSSFPKKEVGQINYIHNTTREDGSTGQAYIQDWSRVIPETKNFYMSRNSDGGETWGIEHGTNRFCYWQESYNEKIGDVWRTFELSIQDNSNPTLNTPFYINSLDGYFADWDDNSEDDGNSAYPYVQGGVWGYDFLNGGGRGDIANYAERINNDFYNRILQFGENNIYGPMNITLLDRVYSGTGNGGTYLPSVIINNNFRFPLLTAGSNASSTSSYNANSWDK